MRPRTALQVLCTSLVIWAAAALPASSATQHVVLLYPERLDLPGLAALDANLTSTLTSNSSDHIEVYREAMDLSRFGSNTYQTLLRDFLHSKYENKKIDVAIGILGPSLDFLLSNGDTIFPGTPIVFSGVDRRELGDRSLPPLVRGILLKREFAPTLEIVLRIHPQTKRVFVVGGTSEFDKRLLDQASNEFRVYKDRLAFTYLTELPLQKLLSEVSQLPPQSIVVFTTLFQDGVGEAFVTHDVVQRVSAAANAPVYGFLDEYVGRGIVGGSLYSSSAQGAEAAKLALRVLAGTEPPGPAMLEVQTNRLLFDWRQMKRWGVSAASLPPGSEIRFYDPTPWEQYALQILAVFMALLLQAALISWLLFERRRRRIAEAATHNTMSDLMHVDRMTTAAELSASIAHEVAQPLTSMVSNANAGLRWLNRATPNIEEAGAAFKQIVTAGRHAGEVITSVRTLFKKETEGRTHIDLNQLIRNAVSLEKSAIDKHDVSLSLELNERIPKVIGDRVQLLQVLLNLIRNAIDAIGSNELRVLQIRSRVDDSGNVLVSVEDSGSGIKKQDMDRIFDPLFTTKSRGLGIGLSICRSIIEGHDGRLWVISTVGQGSTFFVTLPRYMAGDGWQKFEKSREDAPNAD